MNLLLGILISYVLGSVPTAFLAGKLFGNIDIRLHGSKNVGATNTFRVLGKGPGTAVLVIDILKGFLAVTLVAHYLGLTGILSSVLLGISAVSGHNWTVFLKFRGGKGMATSLGVLLGLTFNFVSLRLVVSICILAWATVFLSTGYVSLASILAAVFLPIIMLFTGQGPEMVFLGVIFCVFVVFRHRPNIQRLMAGTESRVDLPFFRRH